MSVKCTLYFCDLALYMLQNYVLKICFITYKKNVQDSEKIYRFAS